MSLVVIKSLIEFLNILLYGTGEKNKELTRKLKHKQNFKKPPKSTFNPQRTQKLTYEKVVLNKEPSTAFKQRVKDFFQRSPKISAEKKLFHKWLKRTKDIPDDQQLLKEKWEEYLERRKRITTYEEDSFLDYH